MTKGDVEVIGLEVGNSIWKEIVQKCRIYRQGHHKGATISFATLCVALLVRGQTMIAIISLFLISMGIYCTLFLTTALGSRGMSGLNKAFSACPVIFLIYRKEIEAQSSFLFYSMLISISIISICSIIGSSNHFVISLDITYFLSLMMIILYHTFKISKPIPLR